MNDSTEQVPTVTQHVLIEPVSTATPPNYTRYIWQDVNSYGKPVGGRYIVDYRVGPDGVEILRVVAEQPTTDLSGLSDDSLGVLEDCVLASMRDAIQRDLDAGDSIDDPATETEYDRADRKHNDRVDRELEEGTP